MSNAIELAAAVASFQQTIARLNEECAEIEAFLSANATQDYEGAAFLVVMRMVFKGEKTLPSGLRKVGEGFNFNGTTPATVYGMTHNDAEANARHFNRAAIREGKRDVEYSVMGLRAFFAKQLVNKRETAAEMAAMIVKHAAA